MARNKFNIDEELEVPFNWSQFKRSLVYIKKYKKNILLMFTFSVLASLLALVTPKIQAYVIDELIPSNLKNLIIVLGVSYFAVSVAIVFINRLRAKISVRTGQAIITDMRTDVFSHLQKLSFDYYDSRPHGKILTRVINYVNNVSDFLTNGMVNAVLQIINLLLILGFMLSVSVKMTLVVLAGLPFFFLYVRITKPRQRRFRQLRANKQSNTTAYLAENINVVKLHEPVSIVDDDSLVLAEVDEAAHLLLEAVNVVLDSLGSHHLAHIGLAGGVAYHSSTAADEDDWLVACLL